VARRPLAGACAGHYVTGISRGGKRSPSTTLPATASASTSASRGLPRRSSLKPLTDWARVHERPGCAGPLGDAEYGSS
jgi:hypothetical protein